MHSRNADGDRGSNLSLFVDDGDDLTDIKSSKLTDRVHELNSISKHGEFLDYMILCIPICSAASMSYQL